MRYSLDLSVLRAVNVDRARYWHAVAEREWSSSEWAGAMCGEVGEASEVGLALILTKLASRAGEAANLAKKILRVDLGIHSKNNEEREILRKKFAKELADVVIYCDLAAANEGIDLAQAVIETFNQVSARENMHSEFFLQNQTDQVQGDRR